MLTVQHKRWHTWLRWLQVTTVCMAWAGPVTAQTAPAADAPAASLVYTRGPGANTCHNELVLRGNVGARLGHDPFEDGAAVRLGLVASGLPGVIRLIGVLNPISGPALPHRSVVCEAPHTARSMTLPSTFIDALDEPDGTEGPTAWLRYTQTADLRTEADVRVEASSYAMSQISSVNMLD